jgi:hypothetical protein
MACSDESQDVLGLSIIVLITLSLDIPSIVNGIPTVEGDLFFNSFQMIYPILLVSFLSSNIFVTFNLSLV